MCSCLPLAVQVERSPDGFHIDLDDFLTGLLLLANELVSFTSFAQLHMIIIQFGRNIVTNIIQPPLSLRFKRKQGYCCIYCG